MGSTIKTFTNDERRKRTIATVNSQHVLELFYSLSPFYGELSTMPRFSILVCIFLFASRTAFAQNIPSNASARSLALGQSAIADPQDEWSANAAFRIDTTAHVRTAFSPAPLNLPDSYTAGVNGDAPLDNGFALGAAFMLFENSDANFAEESMGIQVSKTFRVSGVADSSEGARFASAGMRLRYGQLLEPPPFLPFQDLTADFGATFDLLPQLTAGVSVTHLLSLYNNQGDSIENREAWIGLTYRPTTDLAIHGAFEAAGGADPSLIRAGIEYAFDSYLLLRAGAVFSTSSSATSPATDAGEISGGFGIRTESLMADFAAVRHPDLGTFISFGIGFDL